MLPLGFRVHSKPSTRPFTPTTPAQLLGLLREHLVQLPDCLRLVVAVTTPQPSPAAGRRSPPRAAVTSTAGGGGPAGAAAGKGSAQQGEAGAGPGGGATGRTSPNRVASPLQRAPTAQPSTVPGTARSASPPSTERRRAGSPLRSREDRAGSNVLGLGTPVIRFQDAYLKNVALCLRSRLGLGSVAAGGSSHGFSSSGSSGGASNGGVASGALAAAAGSKTYGPPAVLGVSELQRVQEVQVGPGMLAWAASLNIDGAACGAACCGAAYQRPVGHPSFPHLRLCWCSS